jgi:two-component system, sensor histidine kinase and response regulator
MSQHGGAEIDATSVQVMSHNLKGPIHYQSNMIQFLLKNHRKLKDNELEDALSILLESTESIKEMLENLMQFVLMHQDSITPRIRKVEIPTLISNEANLSLPFYHQKNIRLHIYHLGDAVVSTDSDFIRIILQNLMSNALKFTHENGIVEVNTHVADEFWELEVTDSGIGMTEARIAEILNPELDSNLGTSEEPGMGLGLIIVKKMTALLGGDLHVSSVLHVGTKFKLKFPLGKD